MAENEYHIITVEEYLKSILPNANISENTISGVLIDAGVEPGTFALDLTEKEKDLSVAYLYIRIASNPLTSQKVTDKDGDWEHTEGSEQWSYEQLQRFMTLARDLLSKWDVEDARVESIVPRWQMTGTGFRNIRRY